MLSLDLAYRPGHCVVLNVMSARLVTWCLWRGYDYEPWSNGHSFLSPSSHQDLSLRGMVPTSRVNWLPPGVRMISVLQVPLSSHLWVWRGSSGIEVGADRGVAGWTCSKWIGSMPSLFC